MLQERVLSPHGPEAMSVPTAWGQVLWVTTLACLLMLTVACRLVWVMFLWCISPGEGVALLLSSD